MAHNARWQIAELIAGRICADPPRQVPPLGVELTTAALRDASRDAVGEKSVLFARGEEMVALLAAALDERPAGEDLLDGVRAALRRIAELQHENREANLVRARTSLTAPEVRAHVLAAQQAWQGTIAASARARLRAAPEDMRPDVLAGVAVAALGVALAHWSPAAAWTTPSTCSTGPSSSRAQASG